MPLVMDVVVVGALVGLRAEKMITGVHYEAVVLIFYEVVTVV